MTTSNCSKHTIKPLRDLMLSSLLAYAAGSAASEYDLTALSDMTGDDVPDIAQAVDNGAGQPGIAFYSGADGQWLSTHAYLNDDWRFVALSTVQDANQDGTADDPAVAVLAKNRDTNNVRVESRDTNGAKVHSTLFLNSNWWVFDLVVIDDLDGDGLTDDTAVAVLAQRWYDGRIMVQLRDFSTGALISNTVYLNLRWTPIAMAVADRSAMTPAGTLPPLVGVLAEKLEDNRRVLQSRVAGTGQLESNLKFLNSAWNYLDVTTNRDANSDGTHDDPVWQVLATRPADDVIRVQSKYVSDGSFQSNTVILNSNWRAFRLDTAADIDGNGSTELVISAQRRADDVRRTQIKDFAARSTTLNFVPIPRTPPSHTWSAPGFADFASGCTNVEFGSVSENDFQVNATGDSSFFEMNPNGDWVGSGEYPISIFLTIQSDWPRAWSFIGESSPGSSDGSLNITEVLETDAGVTTFNGTWQTTGGEWRCEGSPADCDGAQPPLGLPVSGSFNGVGLNGTPGACNI